MGSFKDILTKRNRIIELSYNGRKIERYYDTLKENLVNLSILEKSRNKKYQESKQKSEQKNRQKSEQKSRQKSKQNKTSESMTDLLMSKDEIYG